MNASGFPDLPDSLEVERDGDIAVLSLARVAKRNALDDETVRGIRRFFRNVPEDVRAIVLCARGDHFSAGLDLSTLTQTTPIESMKRSQLWYRAFELIQYGSVPVIAALHGAVIGGGLELVSATHIRVADSTTYYALPEAPRAAPSRTGAARGYWRRPDHRARRRASRASSTHPPRTRARDGRRR